MRTAEGIWLVSDEALAGWRRGRSEIAEQAFAAKSTLTLSQWADARRMLSADTGAPGKWRTDRVPYLRRPMDAITDPRVRRVSVMKSARIGASQALVINTAGYYIDEDPAPIIIALPTKEDATKFATQLLQPAIDATPCLASRVDQQRAARNRSTQLQKVFAGGTLQVIGTKSGRAMRAIHGRIILMSEIDAYEISAGKEGDPTVILPKRAEAFDLPKIIEESTPLIKALSRIEPAFEAGSKEYFHVPCPHCGEYQRLVWGGDDVHHGIKWRRGKPETVYYVCEPNGCEILEEEKHAMVRAGEWVATHPERTEHLSFHLNALVSPFEGARWPNLVRDWEETYRKPEKLRVFVNQVLGETWVDKGEDIEAHVLAKRIDEDWPRKAPPTDAEEEPAPLPLEADEGDEAPNGVPTDYLVPAGVGVLTAAVDVQGDRLELAVWGFGAGEEMWLIDHEIIPGDPVQPATWAALDEARARTYQHVGGARLRPMVTFVDTGFRATSVYPYTRRRVRQRVFAIKGAKEQKAPLLGRPSRNNEAKALLYPVGGFVGKETFLARLAKIEESGPGRIHLPPWITTAQLSQLIAEKLVTFDGGRRDFVKTGRNEQLDLAVYCLAGLQALGQKFILGLGARARRLAEGSGAPAPAGSVPSAEVRPPDPAAAPAARRPTKPASAVAPPPRRAGFVQGWRK